MAKFQFSSQAWVRTYGKAPRGRGAWAFSSVLRDSVGCRCGLGPVVFAPGALLLGQAKAWVRANLPSGEYEILT
jgi:hypothetical protein